MKTLNFLKYSFTLIGAGTLAAAFSFYSSTYDFVQSARETTGKVIELERSRSSDSNAYFPVVEFEGPGGQRLRFRSSSGSNPPAFSRGESVVVLFDPASPDNARIKSFFSLWGGPLFLGGMGALFGSVGLGLIISGIRRKQERKWLENRGVEVLAQFQGVERNTRLTVNGRNPWQIVCQWQHPQTGAIHLFRSDNLWFDPTSHINRDTVPVLVDEANLKRYWVNTSFLPALAS